MPARSGGYRRGVSSQSLGCASDRRACQQICGDHALGDAHVPECVSAALHAGGILQPALRDVGRGETAGARSAGVLRSHRHPAARRLLLHGVIAAIDEDGCLHVTDRFSRFSKIGGEMVPHIKVEEKLQELAGAAEQMFVVTAVPDEKKGERLIVLHTLSEKQLEECLTGLAKSDLPALWRPRHDQFVRVEKLPYLGAGKLDLRKARELALETSARV